MASFLQKKHLSAPYFSSSKPSPKLNVSSFHANHGRFHPPFAPLSALFAPLTASLCPPGMSRATGHGFTHVSDLAAADEAGPAGHPDRAAGSGMWS